MPYSMPSEAVNYSDQEFPSETEVDKLPFLHQLHYSPKHFLDDNSREPEKSGLAGLVILDKNSNIISVPGEMGDHDSFIQTLVGEEGVDAM